MIRNLAQCKIQEEKDSAVAYGETVVNQHQVASRPQVATGCETMTVPKHDVIILFISYI
jgi:hypothetical protein